MTKLFDFQAESMPSWWDGNYRMPWFDQNLDLMKGDGASEVVLVPTVYMDSLTSTRVYRDNGDEGGHNTDGAPRTESDDSIRTGISAAKQRGLDVIIKMHVNMQNDDWNALIGPPEGSTEAEIAAWKQQWFASYKESVLHYARLAQEQGAKAFAIGNECESMTGPENRAEWLDIIAAVREVYSGKVTYAATWTEALTVSFWDALDYMGANPYISFTDSDTPTLGQLIDGWTQPSPFYHVNEPIIAALGENLSAMDALKTVALTYGKKLIFTETGFRSLDGTNYDPWTWRSGDVDEGEQASMFQAFYKIITDRMNEGWIGGYWLWNYDASTNPSDPSPDDGFYTHAKSADTYVEQYFKQPISVEGRLLAGSAAAERLLGGLNHDTLQGGGGDDTLLGGGGTDVVDGGSGDNTAVFSGRRADYVIATDLDGRLTVSDTIANRDGVDTLASVQILSFSDGAVRLKNQAPAHLALAAGPVAEDTAQSAIVGTFSAVDADGDSISYNLLSSDGPFQIDGKYLVLSGPLDFETKPVHTLSVKATDGVGGETTATFAITIADVKESVPLTLHGTSKRDVLTGDMHNDVIFGYGSDDRLSGEAGNDKLYGGTGKDTLSGGSGKDIFVLNSKLSKTTNVDRITDFSVADDTIHLARSIFKKITKKGVLKSTEFYAGAKAHDGDDRVIYNKKTGALFYDADGNGEGAAILVAMIGKNLKMTVKDFYII